MTLATTFQGEVRFLGYADSSRTGPKVTFALADRDELQQFVGLEGKRFLVALVPLGDDDKPVTMPEAKPPEPAPAEKPKGGALARLAGQWCQKPEFADWLQTHYPAAFWSAEKTKGEAPEIAAEVIRVMCGIKSRAELDTDKKAAETFEKAFRGPFRQYLQDGS